MEAALALLHGSAVAVFAFAMLYAAFSDLRSFVVPNWVSGIVVLAFAALASTVAEPWPAVRSSAVTGAAVLGIGFVLFALRIAGAGDVKLLAAVSLWTGWPLLLGYLVHVALAGGVLALMLIVFRRFPLPPLLARTRWLADLHARKRDVPYAVAIALPAILFLSRMPLVADGLAR